jgi:hypothetical protein
MLRAKSHLESRAERSPKLPANRQRTAWFVGLKNTIRFPKYPMAPPAPKLQSKRNAAIEDNSFSQPDGPKTEHSSRVVHINQKISVPVSTRKRHAVRDEPIQTLGRFVPGRPPPGLRSAIRYQPQLSSGKSVRHGIDPLQSTPVTPRPIQHTHSMPGKTARGSLVNRFRQLRLPGGTPSALDPLGPTISSSMAPATRLTTLQIGQANDERRDGGYVTRNDSAEAEHGYHEMIDSQSLSQDESRNEDQGRSRGPTSATLHLDGAALGRWAVDHLGRVLAKPATGMTGVDPRATIPRSRVSPF